MKKKLLLILVLICSLTVFVSCEMIKDFETKAIMSLAEEAIQKKTGISIPTTGNAQWYPKDVSTPVDIVWNLNKKDCSYSITNSNTNKTQGGKFRIELNIDIARLLQAKTDDVGGIRLMNFLFADGADVVFMINDVSEENGKLKIENSNYGYLLIPPMV